MITAREAARGFFHRGPRPSLDLIFAGAGQLDPRVSFSRASAATVISAAGLVVPAAINAARLDHDPVTLKPRGLLIEEQRTNLLQRSAELGVAPWGTLHGLTLAAAEVAAPDGSGTGVRTSFGVGTYWDQVVAGAVAGAIYTLSVWARKPAAGGADFVRLTTNNFSAWNSGISQRFALTAAWQRLVLTGVAISSGTDLRFIVGATDEANTGDATCVGGVELWGFQLEAGGFATSYIPTASAQVTRSADVATCSAAGWYSGSAGTFAIDYRVPYEGDNQAVRRYLLSGLGNNLNNRLELRAADVGPANYTRADYGTGAAVASLLPTTTQVPDANNKLAFAYDGSGTAMSLNGDAVATSASLYNDGGLLTGVALGSAGGTGNNLCGHIRRLRFYPTRLANGQLQALAA